MEINNLAMLFQRWLLNFKCLIILSKMRLFLVFLILVTFVLIPFFIWGETLASFFTQTGTVSWIQNFGSWGWMAGIGLLMSDLLIPIPATAVMAGLGYLYGLVLGGLISSLGSFLSGALGYEICRRLGQRGAMWILGEKDLEKGERLYASVGGWLVVLSRWLPVFPEVVACMAGLSRMPAHAFYLALACGSVPLGFAFSAVGTIGAERPGLAIALSAVLPPVLWLMVRPFYRAKLKS